MSNKAEKIDIPILILHELLYVLVMSEKRFNEFNYMVCDLLFGMVVPKKRVVRAIIYKLAISILNAHIICCPAFNLWHKVHIHRQCMYKCSEMPHVIKMD